MTLHDDEILIAKIEKNANDEVRVLLRKWKDRWNVDVRIYFPDKRGQMTPSKAGVALNVDKLQQLADAISAAEAKARELSLSQG